MATDYARLPPGVKNPPGKRVCFELALLAMREENETWKSLACTSHHKRACVMPDDCHCNCHGKKGEAAE